MTRVLKVAICVLGVTIAVACNRDAPSSHDAALLRQQVCDTIRNSLACARAIESALISAGTEVSRDSSRLLLPLRNGTNAVLVDSMSGEPSGITYSYLGVAQGLDAYLIEVQYYEGTSHLLVWRNTGTRTPLDAVPLVAPGGQRLLTASADLDIQYNPNRVRVYRVVRDSLILEWELEPETWEPVNTRWTSDSSFLVERGRSFLELDTAAALRPFRIVHVTDSWTLDSVSSAP